LVNEPEYDDTAMIKEYFDNGYVTVRCPVCEWADTAPLVRKSDGVMFFRKHKDGVVFGGATKEERCPGSRMRVVGTTIEECHQKLDSILAILEAE
jgi:hypothetical protein